MAQTTDRAANLTTVLFSILRDATAPTVSLTLPERIAAGDIPVQWTAVETGSGIRCYNLEVSADSGTSWARAFPATWGMPLTETQNTGYTFTGTPGVAYAFCVRRRCVRRCGIRPAQLYGAHSRSRFVR